MACSMLFISLGWLLIRPAVIELLLCWTALEPATVTLSIDLSFVLKPCFSAWCNRYDMASICWVSPRPTGFYVDLYHCWEKEILGTLCMNNSDELAYLVVAARHDCFGGLAIGQDWTLWQIQLPAVAHVISVIGLVLDLSLLFMTRKKYE